MSLSEFYADLVGGESYAIIVIVVLVGLIIGSAPWKRGFIIRFLEDGLISSFSILLWIIIIGTLWTYLDGYLEVGFSWSCGTILLLIAIIMPLAPFININFHYLTMIEEKGLIYSVKNWKLPIILGIEQSKRWYVEIVYEGEADPEVRKSRAEDAKKVAEEKAEEEKRQGERDRRFLLGEEE